MGASDDLGCMKTTEPRTPESLPSAGEGPKIATAALVEKDGRERRLDCCSLLSCLRMRGEISALEFACDFEIEEVAPSPNARAEQMEADATPLRSENWRGMKKSCGVLWRRFYEMKRAAPIA